MITEDTVKTGIEELRRQATMLIDTADDIGNPGLVCGSVQAVLVNRLIAFGRDEWQLKRLINEYAAERKQPFDSGLPSRSRPSVMMIEVDKISNKAKSDLISKLQSKNCEGE
jgi:hypothetical protein